MIITDRQRKIIQLLQKGDLTSDKIAEYLTVSTRTVMRDIAELNDSLQGQQIAVIEANYQGQGYHLIVDNQAAFYHHMGLKPDVPLNILLTLLHQPEVQLIDLQERFYLSKNVIVKTLTQLKEQYSRNVEISAKPSKGYQLSASYSTKLCLAANILLEDKATLYSLFSLSPQQYQQWLAIVDRQRLARTFNFLTPTQFVLLALAASLVYPDPMIENQEGEHFERDDKQPIIEFLTDFYRQLASVSKINIDNRRLNAFSNHLQTIKLQLQALTLENINSALNQTSLIFHMQFKAQSSLAVKIFNHLERCIAFPSLLNDFSDIDELILVNPMIYNFSSYFLSVLNQLQQFVILDDYYTFLYFLSAHSAYHTEYNIHLISSRWSVANINQKLIEDKIPNAKVNCYVDIPYFEGMDNTAHGQYIIWNQDESAPDTLAVDMTIKGIFEPRSLTQLKSNLEELSVKLGIAQRFKQPEVIKLSLASRRHSTWLETIEQCCQILLEQNWIVPQEARQLILRENQGHSLLINNIAIPHASSVYVEQFTLFYFQLDQVQLVDGQPITQILLILVNPDRKENSNIFSYLYKVLNQYSKQQLDQIVSLPQLQQMLLNNHN